MVEPSHQALMVPKFDVLAIQELPRFLDPLSFVRGYDVLRAGRVSVGVEKIDAIAEQRLRGLCHYRPPEPERPLQDHPIVGVGEQLGVAEEQRPPGGANLRRRGNAR